MSDIQFIKDEHDYHEYEKLTPKNKYKFKKVKFICKLCNQEKTKSFNSLTLDFLCMRCKTKQTCLEKYGVEHQSKTDKVKDKITATCLSRYGSIRYTQSDQCKEKTKNSNIKKYGVEYFLQSDEFKEKYKQTCLEKYGVEHYSKTTKFKDQLKETCLEQYGVEHFNKLDDIKKKIKQTCLEKYGTETYTQTPDFKEKFKQTCLKKYGTINYVQTEDFKEKYKHTCLEKYGTEHFSQGDEFKEKYKQTCLEKYGVKNYAQTQEYLDKTCQTNLAKYGVEYFSQGDEFKEKYKQTCLEKYGVDSYFKSNIYKNRCLDNIQDRLLSINLKLINNNQNKNVTIFCLSCNKEFVMSYSGFINLLNNYGGNFCPHCSRIITHGKSIKEKQLLAYIKTIYNHTIIENSKQIISPYEIDIYLPDLKLGFEFDGTIWHADARFFNSDDIIPVRNVTAKTIWEHDSKKNILSIKNGIQLIRVAEYDWDNNIEIEKQKVFKLIHMVNV